MIPSYFGSFKQARILRWPSIIASAPSLLLLTHLILRQVEVFRGFGRRSPLRFYCQCVRLRRAVEKVVGVLRRLTTVMAMAARCRVDSIHVLTKDSSVTCAQMSQYSSCLPWKCLFVCCNERRSANEQL